MKNYTKVISLVTALTLLTGCSLPTSFDKKEVKEDESVVNEVVKESEEVVEETTVAEETVSEEEKFEKMLADHYEVSEHDTVARDFDNNTYAYTNTYAMPIDDEYDTWYINGVPMGKTINFRYDSPFEEYMNGITYGQDTYLLNYGDDENTITNEEFKEHSKEMVTCYTDSLRLTDVADDPNAISLADVYYAIDSIRFGEYDGLHIDDLIYQANNSDYTIKGFIKETTNWMRCSKSVEDRSNVFSYADHTTDNEYGGVTYTWKFADYMESKYEFGNVIEAIYNHGFDIDTDFPEYVNYDGYIYSAEDMFNHAMYMPGYEYYHSPGYITNRLTIDIVYNDNNEVVMYNIKYHMPKAIWSDNMGEKMYQDGYNFYRGMIKTGYFNIGVADFEITIHNKDLCPDLNINFIPAEEGMGSDFGEHNATIIE